MEPEARDSREKGEDTPYQSSGCCGSEPCSVRDVKQGCITELASPSNTFLLSVAATSFLTFAVAELIAAIFSNSLSLLGDAVTMIVDSMTYGLNMYAERTKPSASRESQIRLEIYSPLLSVVILFIVSIYIIYDAMNTLSGQSEGKNTEDQDATVDESVMFIFSTTNLMFDVVNISCFYRASKLYGYRLEKKKGGREGGKLVEEFLADDKVNINMCSAYTHVIADTFRSIAVMVASVISSVTDKVSSEEADAYAAIAVCVIIFLTTCPLLNGLKGRINELRALKQANRSSIDSDPTTRLLA